MGSTGSVHTNAWDHFSECVKQDTQKGAHALTWLSKAVLDTAVGKGPFHRQDSAGRPVDGPTQPGFSYSKQVETGILEPFAVAVTENSAQLSGALAGLAATVIGTLPAACFSWLVPHWSGSAKLHLSKQSVDTSAKEIDQATDTTLKTQVESNLKVADSFHSSEEVIYSLSGFFREKTADVVRWIGTNLTKVGLSGVRTASGVASGTAGVGGALLGVGVGVVRGLLSVVWNQLKKAPAKASEVKAAAKDAIDKHKPQVNLPAEQTVKAETTVEVPTVVKEEKEISTAVV
jgi:hypothetical protein